jgi:hypothetical protein
LYQQLALSLPLSLSLARARSINCCNAGKKMYWVVVQQKFRLLAAGFESR